nr:hypothetical protein [Sphingomonas jejuensis]
MKSFLNGTTLFFGLIATTPFLIGLVGALAEGVGFLLFILAIPIMPLVLLLGFGVALARGLGHARALDRMRDRAIVILAPAVLLALTITVAWPMLYAGRVSGTFARLILNREHYAEIIAKVQRHPTPANHEEDGGVTYSVDVGPPVRVAFNPAGFLDNWSGIIFDPTGIVMEARGFDPVTGDFHAPDHVTKLFGGDLVGCRHLMGHYYACSFT